MAWDRDLIGGKLTEGQGQTSIDVYDRNGTKKMNFGVGGKPVSMSWDGNKIKVVLHNGKTKIYSDSRSYEEV